jgi:hypothetical protein
MQRRLYLTDHWSRAVIWCAYMIIVDYAPACPRPDAYYNGTAAVVVWDDLYVVYICIYAMLKLNYNGRRFTAARMLLIIYM